MKLEDREVVMFHLKDGRYSCLDSLCHHFGGPLYLGDIETLGNRLAVKCPWHGYKIDVMTGEGLETGLDGTLRTEGPKQRTHPVEMDTATGYLYVQLSLNAPNNDLSKLPTAETKNHTPNQNQNPRDAISSDRFYTCPPHLSYAPVRKRSTQPTLQTMGFKSVRSNPYSRTGAATPGRNMMAGRTAMTAGARRRQASRQAILAKTKERKEAKQRAEQLVKQQEEKRIQRVERERQEVQQKQQQHHHESMMDMDTPEGPQPPQHPAVNVPKVQASLDRFFGEFN